MRFRDNTLRHHHDGQIPRGSREISPELLLGGLGELGNTRLAGREFDHIGNRCGVELCLVEHDLIPALSYLPRYGMEQRRLLGRAGIVNPWSILHAIGLGAYEGLSKALQRAPEEVIESVQAAIEKFCKGNEIFE